VARLDDHIKKRVKHLPVSPETPPAVIAQSWKSVGRHAEREAAKRQAERQPEQRGHGVFDSIRESLDRIERKRRRRSKNYALLQDSMCNTCWDRTEELLECESCGSQFCQNCIEMESECLICGETFDRTYADYYQESLWTR
jgi:hypothetical protein